MKMSTKGKYDLYAMYDLTQHAGEGCQSLRSVAEIGVPEDYLEQLLGTLRGEFLRFGDTLERMRQRLDQATGELDTATARSRAITRRLNELEDFSPEKDGGER